MGWSVSEARYFGFVAIGAAIVVIGLVIGVFIGPLYMPRYVTVTERFTETKVFTTQVPTTIFRTRSFTSYIPIYSTLTETRSFRITRTWTKYSTTYIVVTATSYITITPEWIWDYVMRNRTEYIRPRSIYENVTELCINLLLTEPGFLLVNYTASKEIYAEAIYRYQIFEGKTRYPEKGLAKQGVFIAPFIYEKTTLCFYNPWQERIELNLTIEYYRKEIP